MTLPLLFKKSLSFFSQTRQWKIFRSVGKVVLSSWFRWITDGSEEDPLASNVVGQMEKVMSLVEQFQG